ncbi:rluD [Symbiodinium microadriaticum]|nr:rluD [Symbiodinium microadriaticum]
MFDSRLSKPQKKERSMHRDLDIPLRAAVGVLDVYHARFTNNDHLWQAAVNRRKARELFEAMCVVQDSKAYKCLAAQCPLNSYSEHRFKWEGRMADSLESTCSRPDDPVLPEHPEKALRCMLSEVLEDKLRSLELRLEARFRDLLRRDVVPRLRRVAGEQLGDTESEVSSNFPHLLAMPPTLIAPAEVTESTSKETAKKDRGEEEDDTPQSKAKRLSITFGASHDETRREHARSLRSSNASHDKLKQTALQVCMRSTAVDMTLAAVILLSSVLVGFEVQYTATDSSSALPDVFVAARMTLNAILALELLLRVYAFGWRWSARQGCTWFFFDAFLAAGSAVELGLDIRSFFYEPWEGLPGFSQLRLLKILRVTRLLRALRIPSLLKYVGPLQTLVSSISHTLWYLVWAAVLLVLMIYTVSILFAQTVTAHVITEGVEAVEDTKPALLDFWKDLFTSMTTCFMAISGGIKWQLVYVPLNELDPIMGFIFILYISFTYFALLNILTGVFCNSAMEALSRDPDIVAISKDATHLRNQLSNLFYFIDKDDSEGITLDEFEVWMAEENGKFNLQALGIEGGDAWTLFKLLDEEACGSISKDAFVDGCLRLRGSASGVDMATLRCESRAMQELLGLLVMRLDASTFPKPRRPSFPKRLSKRRTSAPSCTAVKIFCATDTDRYARCALHAEASHVFFQKEDVFEQKAVAADVEVGILLRADPRTRWIMLASFSTPGSPTHVSVHGQLTLTPGKCEFRGAFQMQGDLQQTSPPVPLPTHAGELRWEMPALCHEIMAAALAHLIALPSGSDSKMLFVLRRKEIDREKKTKKWLSRFGVLRVDENGHGVTGTECAGMLSTSLRLVPDNRRCTSVMGPLVTSQRWSGSLALLEDMFEASILPDVQCWNVAAVRGSHSNWPRALSSVLRMEQLEVVPDVVTFSTAMGTTFGSEWGWGLMLLRHSEDRGVQRDCISYNVAMSRCADAGESCWTSSLHILSALGDSGTGPDATSIRTLLYALEQAKAWQQTAALLDCLDSFRIVPGTLHSTFGIAALRRAEKWEAVVDKLLAMPARRTTPNAACYHEVAAGCHKRWEFGIALVSLSAGILRRSLPLVTSALQLQAEQAWHRALNMLGLVRQAGMIPDAVAITSFGRAGRWRSTLRILSAAQHADIETDLIAYNVVAAGIAAESVWREAAVSMCQAIAKSVRPDAASVNIQLSSGKWSWALDLLQRQVAARLRRTTMHFNTAVSACEKQGDWARSLQVFTCMQQSGGEPNAVTFGGKICADAEQSWPAALHGLHAMSHDLLTLPSAIHYGALLGAAVHNEVWEAALQSFSWMYKAQLPPSDKCIDLVIVACENAGQKGHALMALWQSEESSMRTASTATFCLALARLSVREPAILHAAFSSMLAELDHHDAEDLAALWWSFAMLGAWSPKVMQAVRTKLMASELSLSLQSLSVIAWACASSVPDVVTLLWVQTEARECWWREQDLPWHRGDSTQQLLTITWACSFAKSLTAAFRHFVEQNALTVGHSLDADAKAADLASCGDAPAAPQLELEDPRVELCLNDRLVLYKPPGWEVHDGFVPNQLRRFLQEQVGPVPLAYDQTHSFGFLHRLDVPSSGLVLAAKTYEAFYEMQVQLAAGLIRRKYLAMAHGWMPCSREVLASVSWGGGHPTRSGASGKASKTWFHVLARNAAATHALSLLSVQIFTGRRHQIRSHLAHIGHPLARDELYASMATLSADLRLRTRTCLHRFSLSFKGSTGDNHDVVAQCPADLLNFLLGIFDARDFPTELQHLVRRQG